MTESIIALHNVDKYYFKGNNRINVHENVNLCIPEGRFVTLMGPSGCGKTTLLNLIGGLDHCSNGVVQVAGKRIDQLNDQKLSDWRARRVGFIFQFYNLMPVLDAFHNVELPLMLTNLSKKERRDRVYTALKVVGLDERAHHYPSELSGGQEQRVAIARAIVSDPMLLLADEPTGDLDRATAQEILELLKELNQRFGKTIVMVTHDPHAAEYSTDLINLEDADLTDINLLEA